MIAAIKVAWEWILRLLKIRQAMDELRRLMEELRKLIEELRLILEERRGEAPAQAAA